MNQRKAGTILSYVHIILNNTISLIYTPYMLRMMGQSEYGLYSTASSFISYLSVLSFGIGGAYIRFNARARANDDRDEERRLNGMFLTIFSLLSLVVLIGGIVFIVLAGKLVENTFSNQELFKLRVIMLILTVNMMVSFICNVFMMALQAYEQFFYVRLVLTIASVLQPVANVFALRAGGRSITITLLSFIIGALSYVAMFIYAKKEIQFEVSFHGFDKKALKEIFVFSGFLFLNTITDQITFSTDNIVLSSVKGTSAVAVYNVGASFKGYFQNFSTSISSVFSPQVNQIVAKNGEMKTLDNIFIKVGRIQFYIVSLILIGYCSIGYDFIRIWAGEDYNDAFYIGLLMMIAVFVPAFQNVGLEIQKAKNMHKARSVVYFAVALINIVMTIPFSIWWSGIGAALATVICMFFGTVIFMNYYYGKYIKLDIIGFWKSIGSILPGYIIPIGIGVLINQLWMINSCVDILLSGIIVVISFAVSTWLFSMNNYERKLIKQPLDKIKKILSKKRKGKNISIMSNEKNRVIEYDIMRIVACFCVIMIHVAVFDQDTLFNYKSLDYQAIKLWGVLSRWAVPAFVMLSGMMILPNADKISIKKLIKQRVLRMLFAYIIWSGVYSFYNTYILGNIYSTSKIKTFIDGCFSGEIHMWYLPMLAGLYIASPLLAILVKKTDKKWIKYWLVCLFIFTSLIPFLVKLNIKFISTVIGSINGYMDLQFMGGWTLYFVLGYFVQNYFFDRKQRNLVYICAAIAFAFSVCATIVYCLFYGEPMGVLSYEYPNIIIFSLGVLVFFKETVSKLELNNNTKRFIISISQLTFGIYLIHVLLLKIWYQIGINIQICQTIISVPIVALSVFISGGIIIWLIRKIPFIGRYIA